jgi:nucleoside-diphosphate-sugar epimerase
MKKKIALVIGSKGNVGKKLVEKLKQKKYLVIESDIIPGWSKNYFMADINNPLDLIDAFSKKPDCVFLLSAMVSRVTCEQAKGLTINTNLSGLNNVVQLCKKFDSKLVFFSTSEVYGPALIKMSEDDKFPNPNNFYGLSKLLGEKIVEYEVKNFGLKAVILRPFMIYDENEVIGEHRSAMIRFASNLNKNKSIEVHKNSSRGWLHISDAVEIIERSSRLKNFEIINIGNPDNITTLDLAKKICEVLKKPLSKIKIKNLPKRMTLSKKPSLIKQTRLLKYMPKINVIDGIKLVCERIQNHK